MSAVPQPAAIVHDWFQGFHGSERVVEAMRAGVFGGKADVLTFHAARELLPEQLADAIVKESRIAALPGIRQRGHDPGRWRYLLPWMPFYYRLLDVSRYDVVVSSSHACYTPMRYAWLPTLESGRVSGLKRTGLAALTAPLRELDLAASRRPDSYVAISEAVRERIRRFYGRDAAVIHPPVETHRISPSKPKDQDQFLWVHRLVGYKHPLVVAEAFRGLPWRLVMVGVGPLEGALKADLPPNVELRGWLDREELIALYEESAGFLHVGEEDFGITMVEALAAGTPVIGLDRGGARDIVRRDVDGLLIDAPTVEKVRAGVREVAARNFDPATLAEGAQRFSYERFASQMRDHVASLRSRALTSASAWS
jgi:glycosyltransferase involved in cell wall biosynthesis